MTNTEIYNLLFSGGNYSLPYLIKFEHPIAGTICLINDNQSVTYNGDVYEVSSFSYTEPDSNGDGATLNITGVDNSLIEFFDKADYRYKMTVTGCLSVSGEVQRIKGINHFYGSISYSDSQEIQFTLGKDDRLDMIFNPYNYDTDLNRGNA